MKYIVKTLGKLCHYQFSNIEYIEIKNDKGKIVYENNSTT